MDVFNAEAIPEDCVSVILSLTSPADAGRASLVSSTFRSAVDSDFVWERFLPSDFRDILSRLVLPFKFSSKKELFFGLCNPLLIDGGKKIFGLEKSYGKKSYILSAKALSICWSNDSMYWCYVRKAESRFSESAVLRAVSWIEIQGKMRTQMLSPNTRYGAYLLMAISHHSFGFDSMPLELSVEVGNQRVCSCLAYIGHQDRLEKLLTEHNISEMRIPVERKDAWLEIEIGEFFTGECDEEVKMIVKEVKGYQLKGGITIEGIEIRPIL